MDINTKNQTSRSTPYRKWLIAFLWLLLVQELRGQEWKPLESAPAFRGKQDDIFFIDAQTGWYVNPAGKIYKTRDGGASWSLVFEKPGTFFRCIGFVDSLVGFAGNIGTGYFPNVTDTVPLYKTVDGGHSWHPVPYSGPVVKGLCAIEITPIPYVNHGELAYRHRIVAGGRVGNPAYLLHSEDGGATFQATDMNAHCAFILDIRFVDGQTGFIAAGSHPEVAKSNAVILRTKDGGKSWKKVYQSRRPYEITWKASFPTARTGYVTVQSYNPDSSVSRRYVLKTTNGGRRWKEVLLTDDHSVRPFGIGFIDASKGWVGTNKGGYATSDGGQTWRPQEIGPAVNKIRVLRTPEGVVCYAIGARVYRWEGPE